MDKYYVFEGYMETLRKKIATIRNKCAKFGCDFHYAEVGEEYRDVRTGELDKDGKPITVRCKFIAVEAEGTAAINGWKLVASVEHTEKGNIYSKAMTEIEIPERYRTTSSCTCEHCGTNRARKVTFIIRNAETNEFKQVGNSCLKDFTGGMSATGAAWFASIRDVFEEAENYEVSGVSWHQKYYDVKEVLCYAAETIRHFGYKKSPDGTKEEMTRFFDFLHGDTRYWGNDYLEETRELINKVHFNAESPEAIRVAEDALEWISKQESVNDYMHNLKVVTSLGSCGKWNFGLLVSLLPAFNRELEAQAERRKLAEEGKLSEHVGQVGDKVTVDVESVRCLTSWQSCFDGYHETTTYLYKIAGKDGNVYTWKTAKMISEEVPPKTIKGTVKAHNEFRGVKQTELTRCRMS